DDDLLNGLVEGLQLAPHHPLFGLRRRFVSLNHLRIIRQWRRRLVEESEKRRY
uniref:Uncharacterized protein n=1 Tax=Plectus sambesii TaxID=2011161 RepID=A0A914VXQ0_9BILA